MKGRLLNLLTLIIVVCLSLGLLTACVDGETLHEHSFSTEWVKGNTHHYHACSCGEKTDYEEHDYNQGEVTKAPSLTETGIKTFTCLTCGKTKDEELSKEIESNPPAHEHSYTSYVYNNDAKCGVNGTKTAICDNGCNVKHTITAENTALEHSYTNYYSDKNATYESDGTKTAVCDNGCGTTHTVEDVGSMLVENEIRFNTLLVDGTDVYGKVSNVTTEFNFNSEVHENGTATYVLSMDKYGSQQVLTKIVPLSVGDNEFYVFEMLGEEINKTYKVTIHRNYMFTVTFNTNGGTSVNSQIVEEGKLAVSPKETTREGYTFDCWDYDFNTPITSDKTITALWTAHTDTPYVVEYYLENLENDNYTLQTFENKTGATNSTVYANIKTFEHFTAEDSLVSGIVKADGSTVIKVYYQRSEYTVTFNGNGGRLVLGNATQTVKYGGSAVAPIFEKEGYSFINFDKSLTNISENYSVTASWKINEYTITIVYGNGQENKFITQDFGSTIDYELPANLEKDGYTFDCWDKSMPFTMPASNLIITANWKAIFNLSGGEITSLTDHGKTFSEITIPEIIDGVSIISIGDNAFQVCSCLENITISKSVTNIGYQAFYNCGSLKKVNYTGTIDQWVAIEFCSYVSNPLVYAKNLYVNEGLFDFTKVELTVATKISNYAFAGCSLLESVVIPDSVTSIGDRAFYSCSSLESIIVDSQSEYYKSIDGDLYSKDGKTLIQYAIGKTATSFEVPNSVTIIDSYAFNNCESLLSIVFEVNSQLKNIENYAFSGCYKLANIIIPSSVTRIGEHAFSSCSSLGSIIIPNSVTSIDGGAFYYCISLRTIIFEEDSRLESVADYAFSNCNSLESIIIPNSVTNIGEGAFSNCWSLGTVEFEENSKLKNIESNVFEMCGLSSIVIPNSVTTIGNCAFDSCHSLLSIVIPSSVTSIGDSAFYSCRGLTNIKYCGSKSQWESIIKGSYWDGDIGPYPYSIIYNYTGE